ncbi:MAG: PD-(D/E)XK nuclease family protein [Acidimicrobiia bacterium]|nr:PD-(D/E)XK nuclease family protein [Acidimicrobiia bacterium]MYC57134.1 PD-(D/E)XK nuclease family protein [Acidimicrobiia bacterium]MYG94764.1 PD-(D/E)XK nuclease family protein [Acidimicrobiia bacterium]MYI30211.1 PD-(D/E)XK nuclease family protein [Acidimicrobiia bacterium]
MPLTTDKIQGAPTPDAQTLKPQLIESSARYVPQYISPSSVFSFKECARRWKFRYVDRLPDPPGEAAVTGTFAHMVLERLMQESAENRTMERAKKLARELWPRMEKEPDYQCLGLDDRGGLDFRKNSWKAIEGLWALEDPSQVKVAATEQDIKVEINGVPFRGVIDRVDEIEGGLVITDYKSGKAPSERFSSNYATQMLLYSAALTELHSHKPVKAQLLYLGQKVVEVEITDENLAEAVNELRSTWLDIMQSCISEEFEASAGPLCGWCPFATQCPEGTAEVLYRDKIGRLRSDAPALKRIAQSVSTGS